MPTLLPIGDSALLVRFSNRLEMDANRAAIAFAESLAAHPPAGTLEITPNLVSVLVRYDALTVDFAQFSAELRLRFSASQSAKTDAKPSQHHLSVRFGGQNGPDLNEVAETLSLSPAAFIKAHNANPMRVLATGFAPGFVYCGLHAEAFHLPRRRSVRPAIPAGSILFAAGQTAITGTNVPTGWHVIGRTDFQNFDPMRQPPTLMRPGDEVIFKEVKS